jgi:hypothetical protein
MIVGPVTSCSIKYNRLQQPFGYIARTSHLSPPTSRSVCPLHRESLLHHLHLFHSLSSVDLSACVGHGLDPLHLLLSAQQLAHEVLHHSPRRKLQQRWRPWGKRRSDTWVARGASCARCPGHPFLYDGHNGPVVLTDRHMQRGTLGSTSSSTGRLTTTRSRSCCGSGPSSWSRYPHRTTSSPSI